MKVPGQQETAAEFTDEAEISSSFQTAVERLSALGIIKGVPNLDSAGTSTGTVRFDPKGAASRAQAAAFISRMLDAAEQSGETMPSMPGGAGPGGQTAEPKESIMDVVNEYLNNEETSQSRNEVELANAFLATLTEEEADTVQYEFTEANAAHWTNFPANSTNRNGAALGDLSDESITTALAF